MNNRLEQFMRAEQLTAAKLAEILQIQPSSISHLLSGRNKPSYEFISRIMKMFPELNPDWLINDEGEMYRSKFAVVNTAHTETMPELNYYQNTTTVIDNKEDTQINNVNIEINQDDVSSLNDDEDITSIKPIQKTDNESNRLLFEERSSQTGYDRDLSEACEPKASTLHLQNTAETTQDTSQHTQSAQNSDISKIMIMYADMSFEILKPR